MQLHTLLACAVSNKSLTSSDPDVAGPTQAASQTSIAFFEKGKLACSAPAGSMGIIVIAFIQLA
jgi:hypothetical protein